MSVYAILLILVSNTRKDRFVSSRAYRVAFASLAAGTCLCMSVAAVSAATIAKVLDVHSPIQEFSVYMRRKLFKIRHSSNTDEMLNDH
ncbi:hypothetical protein ROZALSC1DRAFT_27328 [Rozella allomycis CSF55]|uniref:Uncharacterized protein n=1 Tax=Rozella allomycis (strain CSF55) TaxID=988480 RepID=A0A4P9YNR8_ROZAC|nr:hypothetical protein ROZALSC1DRAFT_27328 [Rozella allomycis CSF55]